KKIGCGFGSHGGMGGAVARIEEALKEAGIEVIDGGFHVNYRPDEDELTRAYELGRRVAQEIRAR
ncbi:MAG: FprA family A-type flavoprotein, partial [Methanoculleus sp.]